MVTNTALIVFASFGFLMRTALFNSTLRDWAISSPEFTTPLTSWPSVTEGLSLIKHGISPYSGDIFHMSPLSLRLLDWLNSSAARSLPAIFCVADVLTALCLYGIAKELANVHWFQQQKQVGGYSTDAAPLLLQQRVLHNHTLVVLVLYLFNPLVILTCAAQSVSVFHNLLIAAAILFALRGHQLMSLGLLAYSTYESLYPLALLVPFLICFLHQRVGSPIQYRAPRSVLCLLRSIVLFGILLFSLFYCSARLEGDWKWLRATHGTMLMVPDLSPNLGLFWYFFTEMFEHFRWFFLAVFQMNAFIYTLPLALVLREHPAFLIQLTLLLISAFKSYPCYADFCLPLALLPSWTHLAQYVRNRLVIAVMLVCVVILAPVLRYLWLEAGSANANFYFAIGLVYCTAQVFLLTDLLYAFLRREFHLKHGTKPVHKSGKVAELVLK